MAKKNAGKIIQMLTPENYIRTKSRTLPIYECWISSDWEETKLPVILVARKHNNGNITYGTYMVDLLCLGVKNTYSVFNIPLSDYRDQLDETTENIGLKPIDYVAAHNIIYAAVDFAEEFGFKPCKEFTSVTKYLLEEDNEDIELIEIECGDEDGQPIYVYSKSHDDLHKVQKIIAHLEQTAGPGNYSVVDEDDDAEGYAGEDDFEDDEDYFGDKTFAEKKATFLMLSSVKIKSENVETLMAVTNSLYRDIIDPLIESNYYDELLDELSVEILIDEEPNEFFGLSPEDGIISEEVKDLFFEVLTAVDDGKPKKARKKLELLNKLSNGIPAVFYAELEILKSEKSKEYLVKRQKYALKYPSYSMIRLLELSDLLISDKKFDQSVMESYQFDTIFHGRKTLHRLEFLQYMTSFSFLVAVNKDLNKLEALHEVLDEFDLPEEDLNLIEKTIALLKVSLLVGYFEK
jgi:hypothetical protein